MTLLGAIMAGSANNTVTPPVFNPLTTPGWYAAYWASDPDWTNPGDGNALTSWRDGSGNGRTLDQVTSTPLYRASVSGLNNKPAIEFTSDAIGITSANFGTLSQPNTIVIVGKIDSSSSSARFIIDSRNATNRQVFGHDNSNNMLINAGASLNNGTKDFNKHLWVAYFNGNSSALEIDGTATTGDAGTNSLGGLTIGGNTSGTANAFNHSHAFVGVFAGDARAQDWWSDFENWVESYYGISIS